MDDFTLEFGQTDCQITPNEAVPHNPSQGDCTFQHSLCDWKLVEPEGELMFKFNQTNGQDLHEANVPAPETDHYGDPHGKLVGWKLRQ